MIPARIEHFLKTLSKPDFFIGKSRTAADEIHDLIRQYVDQGTATIEVKVDLEFLMSYYDTNHFCTMRINKCKIPLIRNFLCSYCRWLCIACRFFARIRIPSAAVVFTAEFR